jgi:hypothetical protein
VTFTATAPDGTLSTATGTTNAQGKTQYTLSCAQAGSYSVVGAFAGTAAYKPSSSSTSVSVTGSSDTYDYLVDGQQVLNSTGGTAYTGTSFTTAFNWAVTKANARVRIAEGTFQLTSNINMATGVTLEGSGIAATTINFVATLPAYLRLRVNDVDNVSLGNFRTTGNGRIEFSATGGSYHSNLIAHDIHADGASSCVYVRCYGTSTLQNVQILRCQGNDCYAMAFYVGGDYTNQSPENTWLNGGWVQDVTLEDCVALRCGIASRPHLYVVGFDLAEGANIQTMRIRRCTSNGNYMNGYHFEAAPKTLDVVFEDCTANDNGLAKGEGVGFEYRNDTGWHETTLIRCTASGNMEGDSPYGEVE